MSTSPTIRILPDGVHVDDLRISDPAVIDYLNAHQPDLWGRLVNDMLSVGARGLLHMGVGARLDDIDERVRATVSSVLEDASGEVESLLAGARAAIVEQLDPEVRSSAMGMTLERLAELQASMTKALDVDHASSVTATLINRLTGLLGPEGIMEQWVRDQFDQANADSPLGRLGEMVERRFDDLRDAMVYDRGTKDAIDQSPRKGFAFEDTIEHRLRSIAAGIGGALVERTALAGGMLRSDSKVGDFVLQLEDGARIVVEAKNTDRIAVGGKDGMLSLLDRAMANRRADAAICVSSRDAYPGEVGSFAIHGKRVLCVDDGSGVLLGVAIRILRSLMAAETTNSGLDLAAVEDRVQRIRALANRFSGAKSTLTKASNSISDVQQIIDEIRTDLLDHSAELAATLSRSGENQDGGPVLRSA
jgi:hypothetical protein